MIRATECNITLNANEIVTTKAVVNAIRYYYGTEDKMTKKVITSASGSAQTIYYENSEDNTVVKFTAGGRTITSHSKTDSFGRKVFDELQLGTGFVSRQFHYHAGVATEEHVDNNMLKSSPTTQLVSQIVLSRGRTISYEYDEEERITKIDDSVDGITTYTYDALGQLVTETVNGITTKFEYDNYGNILAKGVIDETGEIAEATKSTYVYGDDTWKDLLTAYNGQPIVYDAQGNPTSYLGHTLTWEKGRQLKFFDNIAYTYNANGIRTSKTVDGIKHTYTLEGTKILREEWNGNTLIPLYDNEETVCGILYNNEPYYFQKNLQGDVIAIVDKDADVVARYTYDAWGVCTVTQDSVGIANVNPFRYRGYYFDHETNLYYLQSRCYDPELGRFLNSDDPEILDNASDYSILSTNKYCYCLNAPVNNSDEYGSVAGTIVKMIGNFFFGMLGGMLGMYLSNVTLNVFKGKQNIYAKNDSWGAYVAEGVKSGAFAIFGSKLLYKIIAAIGAAVIKQVIDIFFSKKAFDLWGLITDILIGVFFVIAIHFGATLLKKLPKKNRTNKMTEKIKSLIKKIARNITVKLKKIIKALFEFFKTFAKRFSISYAKKCATQLINVFR